ncbi:MAG: nucleotide exchange factor GrpE [Candidatus Gracilibacteria bacterium]|jgi:molecular chaperone GrpE
MTHQKDPKKDHAKDQTLEEKLKAAKAHAHEKDQHDAHASGEIEELKKQLAEMTELAKRTMADMQNLKRRTEEERLGMMTMSNADLIKDVLPIVDNLDRAIAHMPEGAGEWYKGIEMSIKNLHKVLENNGLKKIETVGKHMDPNLHHALVQAPGEKDIILEELEAGYILGDRVIRHAKVKVGNGSAEQSEAQ